MTLTINGQTKELSGSGQTLSIADAVAQFCQNKKNILAELNGQIIPPSDWANATLKEGDTVELIAFVGGG